MATRKRKPWNADLEIPGITNDGPGTTPKATPETMLVGHSTSAHLPAIECWRCERMVLGIDPGGLDHVPSCQYRGSGRDPGRGS